MAPLQTIYRQLEDMGEFSKLILCDRAKNRGIKEIDYLIRKGNIPEQLRQLASTVKAEIMVLGRPIRRMGHSVFSPAKFVSFVENLEQETGIRIVQVIHVKS